MEFSIPVDPIKGPTLSVCISKLNRIAAFIRDTIEENDND